MVPMEDPLPGGCYPAIITMKMVTLKRPEQIIQGGLHLHDYHVELLDCIVLLQEQWSTTDMGLGFQPLTIKHG